LVPSGPKAEAIGLFSIVPLGLSDAVARVNCIPPSRKTVELKITTEVLHRGRWFVARCPELDIASPGASAEEAKRHVTPDNLRQPPTLAR